MGGVLEIGADASKRRIGVDAFSVARYLTLEASAPRVY